MLIKISRNNLINFLFNAIIIITLLWITYKIEIFLFSTLNYLFNKFLIGSTLVNNNILKYRFRPSY